MEVCRDLKEKYDDCFNNWFAEKFLKGDHNDSKCAPFLKVYKECIEVSSMILWRIYAKRTTFSKYSPNIKNIYLYYLLQENPCLLKLLILLFLIIECHEGAENWAAWHTDKSFGDW